ncbi:osmotically-inducible lipoprotein OsmB [Dickeya zeae]|jgi:osmotically inducible lipoprotein OsmB|uniref:osmotically-inducible lipoprotein OsmB n=1 Tax=Dickeya zeae TaxID=204042 RepID=UPI00036AC471|nr:osmotically-inducible lipoprotein OsmB [Dickeya zeae]PXW48079.1 osmotically inducible lipoprotein OsmB [Erwinia sp. AG740]AUQ25846.1 osmotically-inducible lipoprotein OsmB [Dickeya zeae]MCA6985112.1 osmotically-inducible lipoprotein OsmB [Dickeya zeae]UJR54796.1 osmotically-inducible lipoprotein OsmB [Dickeya zeae MS1]UJR58914.1 osmotically-inducible lipoprotein OsmB [Dickeya zeae]
MQINKKFTTTVLAMVIVSTLAGCAGMNKRQRNTAIGAGIGAVGGAVLTNGSALGTVGGAAVGGIIGHQTTR